MRDNRVVAITQPFVIGRALDCQLRIEDERVSLRHAAIRQQGVDYILEDLGSREGVFVNNERITQPHRLVFGDGIRIGIQVMTYFGGQPPQGGQREAGAAADEEREPVPAYLVSTADGQEYELNKPVMVVGRGSAYDIPLRDPLVSRPHAEIAWSARGHVLTDLGSMNGTLVNGRLLSEAHVLKEGDRLTFGGLDLVYHVGLGTQLARARRLVAFFTLKGGAGTTLLATNTAILLAQHTQKPVGLVELHTDRPGHAAILLGVRPKQTLADLAKLPADEIASALANGMLVQHETGVRLLAAPASPLEQLPGDFVENAISSLQDRLGWVVVDMEPGVNAVTRGVLKRAGQVVVPFTPERTSVRSLEAVLWLLRQPDLTGKQVVLVLNHLTEQPWLTLEAIQQQVQREVNVIVPYGGREVADSVHNMKPLVLTAPDHPFTLALSELVARLVENA